MLSLGLDAGGTSTRATLVSTDGECLGYGTARGGNPISSGTSRASSEILAAIERACESSETSLRDVTLITLAMAGYLTQESTRWLEDPLAEAGFTGRLSWSSDLLATYFSGTFSPNGYAMVSGTGAAVIRVTDGEVDTTRDGLGWLLGDEGSGFWIGHRVARAVAAELDGRGPATALTEMLLTSMEITDEGPHLQGRPAALSRLITALYAARPVELAAYAPLAFGAGDDPVARGILVEAGQLLAHSVASAYDRPGPIITGGSVLAQPGALRDAFTAALHDHGIDPELTPVSDGAIGAAVLALRGRGVDVDAAMFDRVTTGLERLRRE